MDSTIEQALRTDRTIDITTKGRRSGSPARIEMWFHNVDDRIYLTGLPGPRDWYANLLAEPSFTFHLKESVTADLAAVATPVLDPAERRRVLEVAVGIYARKRLEERVAASPLVEVRFPD